MEKNYTARQFGSLYFNGKSQTISSNPQDFKYEPGMTITIGDTQPFGCAIPWIKPKGMNIWISKKILGKIPFTVLEQQGYVDGIPVEIDEKNYICRLIRDFYPGPFASSAEKQATKDEWNRIKAVLGPQINIIDWKYPMWIASDARLFYGKVIRDEDGNFTRCQYASGFEWGFRPVLYPVRKKKVPENPKSEKLSLPYDSTNIIKIVLPWGFQRDNDAYFVGLSRPVTEELRESLRDRLDEASMDNVNNKNPSKVILEDALKRFKITTGVTAKIIDIPFTAKIFC